MHKKKMPVGVFVPADNRELIQRLIEPNDIFEVYVNDLVKKFPIEIYIGDCEFSDTSKGATKRCLVLTEPPEVMLYQSDYLDRFDFIAGPRFEYLNARTNLLVCNPIIPYFVGVQLPIISRPRMQKLTKFLIPAKSSLPIISRSIPEIVNYRMSKTKSISAIISSKRLTPHQIDRINFIQYLQRNSRIPIQVRGGLNSPVRDKFSILEHSTHHIAIENSIHDDYWTEKLSDSILSLNFTFYAGAPNLDSYFDRSIFHPISLTNFKRAMNEIEITFFDNVVDFDALIKERMKLINQNSLMTLIQKLITIV